MEARDLARVPADGAAERARSNWRRCDFLLLAVLPPLFAVMHEPPSAIPRYLARPEAEEAATGVNWNEGKQRWEREDDERNSQRTAVESSVVQEEKEKSELQDEVIWAEWDGLQDPANPFNVSLSCRLRGLSPAELTRPVCSGASGRSGQHC